jgi:lysophospholipase L1-like esterase
MCLGLTIICTTQEKNRYDADIATIKAYDKIYETPTGQIVFTGSSSIRKWNNLQAAFGVYNVINRGIGGAVIDDIAYHLNDLVFTYKPRQIVLYVGENNLPDETQTPEIILNKTVALYKAIRAKLPQVPIVYIGMKPSPSRDKYQQKCKAANDLIEKFIATEKNTVFVDVFTPMLVNGKSRPELFVGDMLHMNKEGYTLWEKLVQPFLLKQDVKK